jgi:hypothetical protein
MLAPVTVTLLSRLSVPSPGDPVHAQYSAAYRESSHQARRLRLRIARPGHQRRNCQDEDKSSWTGRRSGSTVDRGFSCDGHIMASEQDEECLSSIHSLGVVMQRLFVELPIPVTRLLRPSASSR